MAPWTGYADAEENTAHWQQEYTQTPKTNARRATLNVCEAA